MNANPNKSLSILAALFCGGGNRGLTADSVPPLEAGFVRAKELAGNRSELTPQLQKL